MQKLFVMLVLLTSFSVQGQKGLNLCSQIIAQEGMLDPRTQRALEIYEEMVQIRRESGNEKQVIDWIEGRAKARGLATYRDDLHNLLVRRPGKGETIVWQAHTDMVPAVAGVKAGEPLGPHYDKGIELEYKDGYIHTRGKTKNSGIDNATAAGLLIAMMEDPSITVSSEFIFSVQEENGIRGASGSKLPITGRHLISVDQENSREITIGSMGAKMIRTTSQLKTHLVDTAHIAKIDFSDFLGGHSGGDIHLNVVNAAEITAKFLEFLQTHYHGKWDLVRWEAGTPGNAAEKIEPIFNVIPPFSSVTLALHGLEPHHLRQLATEFFNSTIESHMDERGHVEVHEKEGPPKLDVQTEAVRKLVRVISEDQLGEFLVRIGQSAQRIVSSENGFPNNILASSNLSFVQVKDDGVFTVGVMPRSFRNPPLAIAAQYFETTFQGYPDRKTELYANYNAWEAKAGSKIERAYLKVTRRYTDCNPALAGGGLEAGVWLSRYPILEDAIVVGFDIDDPHKPTERARYWSFNTFVHIAYKTAEELAKSAHP